MEQQVIETTETTVETKVKKSLPAEYARAAEGILKRLDKMEIIKAFVFRKNIPALVNYIMTEEIDGLSPEQLVATIFFGAEDLEFGKFAKKKVFSLPSNQARIEEVYALVPEEEKVVSRPKETKVSEVAKAAAMDETKRLMIARAVKNNVSIEDLGMFLDITNEDREYYKSLVDQSMPF